jgi:hypothetical protein
MKSCSARIFRCTSKIAELDVGLEGVGTLNTVLGVLGASTLQIWPPRQMPTNGGGTALSDVAKNLSFVRVAQGPSHLTTRARISMGCASVGTPREQYVVKTVSQARRNTKPSQHVEPS